MTNISTFDKNLKSKILFSLIRLYKFSSYIRGNFSNGHNIAPEDLLENGFFIIQKTKLS